MTDGDRPERGVSEPWPPPYPPEPPMVSAEMFGAEGPADEAPEPLTAVPWSLGAAAGFVAAMFAMTIAAAAVAAWIALADLRPATFTVLLGALLGSVYLLVFAIAWLAARVKNVPFTAAFGIRSAPAKSVALGVVAVTVVGRLAAGAWGLLVEYLDLDLVGQGIDPSALFPEGALGVAALFLVAGVMAPVAEELVFRGVVLSAMERRWGPRSAVLWSSAAFALMHISPVSIAPIFALSLVLGWLFVRTRSLWACIVAHAVFNLTGLAALYAAKSAGLL